jgi:hypothetical protein
MSVEVFGLQDNAAGESAEKTRRAICFMLQRGASIGSVLGGVVQSTDLQVTYQGAGLKIETSPGEAIVPGNVSATESGYYSRNTAAATATLTAANGSNPRIERISLVVLDAAYEGSENIGEIKVSVGTAKAGATLANLEGVAAAPKNSITLAYVLVPAGATTISNADIKNVAEPVSLGIGGLVIRFSTISTTVKPGELVVLEATGITATLSTQAVGCRFGVFCGVNASSVKVKGASGDIYGDFVNGASSVTLTTFQHIELITEGINSLIVAGEPKREQTYSAQVERTNETEYEPSPSRPVQVVVEMIPTNEAELTLFVGGVKIGEIGSIKTNRSVCLSFIVPPGVKWKGLVSGTLVFKSSYLLL